MGWNFSSVSNTDNGKWVITFFSLMQQRTANLVRIQNSTVERKRDIFQKVRSNRQCDTWCFTSHLKREIISFLIPTYGIPIKKWSLSAYEKSHHWGNPQKVKLLSLKHSSLRRRRCKTFSWNSKNKPFWTTILGRFHKSVKINDWLIHKKNFKK